FAGDDRVAGLESLRSQNIGKLAIVITDQRNERGAVRIIFEPLHGRWHVYLGTLEIDDPITPLVAAAAPTHRYPPGIVAPALAAQPIGKRFDRLSLPQLAAVDDHELSARRRRRIEGLQCHRVRSPS